MIMNWVIFGLIVAGIVLVVWGYRIGNRAQMEDYSFIFPMILGAVCIANALLLWGGRWLWNVLPSWPWL